MREEIKQKVIYTEFHAMKVYTNYYDKDSYLLFFDEENKDSHDANHAILYSDRIKDLKKVLNNIKTFYLDKDIVPRIYQTNNGYFKKNELIFKDLGFNLINYGKGENNYYILEDECNINAENRLKIYRLLNYDERLLTDIFGPDEAYFDVLTINKAIKNSDFHLLVGELNGKFISCASIYYFDGIGRIDHVETAPMSRGKGYMRELIKYLVGYHKKYFPDAILYEWPVNDVARKIYYEAGFRYCFSLENSTALIE